MSNMMVKLYRWYANPIGRGSRAMTILVVGMILWAIYVAGRMIFRFGFGAG